MIRAPRKFCPYCGKYKYETEFSNEHILTKALGGVLRPSNPFIVRTCRKCNNDCGSLVDRPFIRNWLINKERARSFSIYVDPECKPILPLRFMGQLEWRKGDEICDYWIGPTGDQIYHFHSSRKIHDCGCVMVILVGNNPVWYPIIMRSAKANFEGSSIHYLNGAPEGHKFPYPSIPEEYQDHFAWIRTTANAKKECSFKLGMNDAPRFAIKVALGLCVNFLSPEFAHSDEAKVLRKALWEKDINKVVSLGLRGSPYFRFDDKDFSDLLNWYDCHLVHFHVSRNELAICVCLYGKYSSVIYVSSTPSHWKGRIDEDGTIWVIAPGLRRFAGPMTMSQFISDKSKTPSGGRLKELQEHFDKAQKFPTFHIPAE